MNRPRTPESPPIPHSVAEWLGQGGTAALGADWTERVLADPELAGLLGRLGPAQIGAMVAHHTGYLAEMLGGPPRGGPVDLMAAHGPLAIDRATFERVRTHLGGALRASGLSAASAARILARVAALAPQVITGYHPPH